VRHGYDVNDEASHIRVLRWELQVSGALHAAGDRGLVVECVWQRVRLSKHRKNEPTRPGSSPPKSWYASDGAPVRRRALAASWLPRLAGFSAEQVVGNMAPWRGSSPTKRARPSWEPVVEKDHDHTPKLSIISNCLLLRQLTSLPKLPLLWRIASATARRCLALRHRIETAFLATCNLLTLTSHRSKMRPFPIPSSNDVSSR
jgi:hypothetical protein